MGILNLDIKEGSFDGIEASGTLDGMYGDYIPSWEWQDILAEQDIRSEWDYEE